MRSSVILTALCAGLSVASPIVKKALVTDIITEYVYVYVTEGDAAPTYVAEAVDTTTVVVAEPTVSATPTSTTVVVAAEPTIVVEPTPVVIQVTSTPVAVVAPVSTTPVVVVVQPSSTPAAVVSSVVVPVGTSVALATPSDYASTVVYHHNIHRRNHSSPDVVNDATLAGYAATVASSCKFAHDLTPGGGGYGQNIASYGGSGDVASMSASNLAAAAITDMWYNGELAAYLPSYYGQANPDFSNFEVWGHFSQVVWKSTTSIGCATQFCKSGTLFPTVAGWFTVCNYGPAGNMGGGYGTNVLPPLGHTTVTV